MGVKSAGRYQSTIVNRFRPMVFVPIPADKYQASYIVFYLLSKQVIKANSSAIIS
jgi:hypothetical protein